MSAYYPVQPEIVTGKKVRVSRGPVTAKGQTFVVGETITESISLTTKTIAAFNNGKRESSSNNPSFEWILLPGEETVASIAK